MDRFMVPAADAAAVFAASNRHAGNRLDHYFGAQAPQPAVCAPAAAVQAAVSAPGAGMQQQPQRLRVFCDGACTDNGRPGARAAWGVSLWLDGAEVDAAAERLPAEEPQTNQRAELRALLSAVAAVQARRAGADIYTDSEYAIHCATTWGRAWRAKGWTRPGGKPILHLDLVQPLVARVEAAAADPAVRLALHHVRGHQGAGAGPLADGNNRADALATGALR